jgi:adenosylcobinamide kinase/adenosylcobinamide-phosphate guanylyltransferase
MANPMVLVLGGTRSGKSTFAIRKISELAAGRPIHYLATAAAGDPELDERIRRHQVARPSEWQTTAVGTDLPAAMRTAATDAILLDGLTLWLSSIAPGPTVDIDTLLDGAVAASLELLVQHRGPAVVVSDEIGLGMVPMDPYARAFRDLQGLVHQRLADTADEVYLTIAGLAMELKSR